MRKTYKNDKGIIVMKKNIWVIVLSITMLILGACGGGGDEDKVDGDKAEGSKKSLRAASSYPTTDRSISAFGAPLLEIVGEQSDDVDFELFTGGELVET